MTESQNPAKRSVPTTGSSPRATRLLVVDDDDAFLTQICGALTARGYAAQKATDAITGQMLADRIQPALVLVDMGLSGMDSFGLVRSLLDPERESKPAVFLMMDTARREDIAMGTALGVRDFILKASFTIDDLVSRIENRLHAAFPAPPPPPSTFRDSRGIHRPRFR